MALTWLLVLTLRSTAILAAALGLVGLLRRATAGARHQLLTLTAVALLLLPALPSVLPRWELPLVTRWLETLSPSRETQEPGRFSASAGQADEPGSAVFANREPGSLGAAAARPAPGTVFGQGVESLGITWGAVAMTVYLIGTLASLVRLARALRWEGRLLAGSRPLAGPWLETLAEARRSMVAGRSVRLLTSGEIQTPLTGGWRRPAVLLPSSAALWAEERRRVVVQHELVHVARSDALRRLAWRLVAALYWFHPLARLLAREAGVVGEQACDETVLDLGTRPSAYARHLLEIAESLRAEPLTFASALPMVDRSQLERRVHMILDPRRSPGRGRATAAFALALLTGIVVAVGAATPRSLAESARAAAPEVPPAKAVEAQQAIPAAAGSPAEPVLAATGAPADVATPVCADRTSGTFSGSFNEGPSGTGRRGLDNGDFALQQHIGGGRRLCARVHGAVRFDERDGSIRELPRGSSVLIETSDGGHKSLRMLVTAEGGQPQHQWWRNGVPGPADDSARAWLADALQVTAAFRAMGSIQGQVGSLQGAIGSIQGELGSLQGQIGLVQGQQGSLQGKVGLIQGEQGSLQGAIGSHQGAIGSLEGGRWQASAAQQDRIDREIETHIAAIKKLEAEMAGRGFSRRMSEAEAELRAFEKSGQGRTAEIERQIEAVHAEERIGALEREIEGLHAADRIGQLERQMRPALERLHGQIDRIGG